MKYKERETWIDWSKMILIWMVVLGHVGATGIGRDFIYAFHIPAFFIISGYLFRKHSFLRLVKSLLIPILFFSIINLFCKLPKFILTGNLMDILDMVSKCLPPYWKSSGGYIGLYPGVWFIMVLFLMRLILGIPVVYKKYKYFLVVFLLYMAVEPLFIDQIKPIQDYYVYKVISCMPFMLFGLILKEYKDKFLNLNTPWLIALFVLYVILTTYIGFNGICEYVFSKGYLLFSLNAVIASIFLFNICQKFKNSSPIIILSKGTLLILGLHITLYHALIKVFGILQLYVPIGVMTLFYSIVIMWICYYLIKLALRYCPIIIGK